MHFSPLVFISTLLLPAMLGAQEPRQANTRQACATDEELVVGGVTLEDTPSVVRKKLGNPASRKSGTSEDDGGEYPTVTYTFKHIEVVFGRGGIERISTLSPRTKAARGITAGMAESEVAERLGFTQEVEEGPYQIRLQRCRQPSQDELILVFAPVAPASGKPVKLVEISVTRYGP